jgi:hypothetical protein
MNDRAVRLAGAVTAVAAFVVCSSRAIVAQQAPEPSAAFVGPLPNAAGTPCPDESDPQRHLVVPPHITFSGDSIRSFLALNSRSIGIVAVTIRLDGAIAVSFPTQEQFDPDMRATLLGFTKSIFVVPPIPGCAHPAGLMLLRFTVPAGDVTMVPFPVPSGSPAAGASPAR